MSEPTLAAYYATKCAVHPLNPILSMTKDFIFRNTFSDIEYALKELDDGHGTRFAFECYDLGHLYNLAWVVEQGSQPAGAHADRGLCPRPVRARLHPRQQCRRSGRETVAETSDDDWDLVVGVNCKGVFDMCREVLPIMQEYGGSIVNLGSISGVVSDPAMAVYNASKAFVHGLTRPIAVDHGPEVRSNAVSPGWIMTGMAEGGLPWHAIPNGQNPTPCCAMRQGGSACPRMSPMLWPGSSRARPPS